MVVHPFLKPPSDVEDPGINHQPTLTISGHRLFSPQDDDDDDDINSDSIRHDSDDDGDKIDYDIGKKSTQLHLDSHRQTIQTHTMSLSLFSRTALRASSSLAPAATATAGLRYFSQTALRAGDSSVVQAENEKAIATKIYKQTSHIPETTGDMNHNTPDYHAPVDHGTS